MQGNFEVTFMGCSFVAGDIAYRDGQLWVARRTPSLPFLIPPSCPCPPCPCPCPFPCCCSSLAAKHQLVPPHHLLHKTHAWEPLNATLPKSRGPSIPHANTSPPHMHVSLSSDLFIHQRSSRACRCKIFSLSMPSLSLSPPLCDTW